MSWQFGNVQFDTYGVKVSRSQGILDLPASALEGTDWLNEDGKDYWEPVQKYNEREIILNCWIPGDGFTDFKAKVNAFTTALKTEGWATLLTPYNSIDDCSITSGITIVREANFVNLIQVGTFTLRVIVKGDDKWIAVAVYDAAPPWGVKDYLLTSNLVVNRTLQGDSYATCTIEARYLLDLAMYDSIRVNTNGLNDEPYYLMYKPDVVKVSSNKFRYNLRLDHGSILLKQSQFLFEGESEFDIFADLDTLIDLVVTNSDRFISGKFVKGTIASTIRKNHNFKGEDCFSIVKRLAQEYGLEFDIRYITPGAYYSINIVEQIATTKAITLQYGKGNGLFELSRLPINRDNLVTVLWAYGSAKNLKPDYRSGKKRLEFDGNPLKQNELVYMGVEKTVFFDDVYPQRTATVTGYYQKLPDALTVSEKEVWPGGIYRVTDSSLEFDINDYLLGGLTAKIRMKTGDLAGYEFEIQKYDHATAEMFIIPFKDEKGFVVPNSTLQISIGDEYTLVDIDQPSTYVAIAEAELLAQAQEYLDKFSVPEYPYNAKVHPAFLAGIALRFEVGDRITIIDTNFGINQLYRISQFNYHLYTGVYELTLSEHRILTRRERQQIAIERLERTAEATNAEKVETIRKDQMTTAELSGLLLDPNLEKLKVDNIVRKESIDPIHLGYDTGMPQVSIENGFFEANFGGDYDKINVDAGKIVMHNFNALPRYEIAKLKAASLDYDPTREWSFDAQEITIPDNEGYWIYAKLPLASESGTCTFLLQKTHVEIKQDLFDGYLIYKIGYVTSTASPRHLGMLWGNVKLNSTIKEIADEAAGELDLRTGWNPDALEKVRVRTVLLSKAFDVLAVAGYSTVEYWHQGGKVVTMGAYTVDLGATYETVPTGKHYIYFDATGIHATQTPWSLARKDVVFTGVVYWNNGSLYTGWHCHSWNYPADMRAASSPQITSGLAVTVNALESHKIDISDGVLKFADIEANIRGNVTGHETFKQQLVALEARRLWKAGGLWYDDLESELVAKLDGTNNVQYCDPATGLQSLVDGEYTAVWVVGTYCNHRPVKIVLGSFKGSTAAEAKTLNTPQSFIDLAFDDCAEVNHVISRVIIKDIAIAPYYEIVEIDDTIRDDFEETPTFEQVQADWNEVDTDDPGYIRNKPVIPAAQIQSDWSQADSGAVDYIKNKPSIPTNTDEKVKYDATDPASGYLSEKIIAGTNVTISEGSGADENKLVISASGGGGGLSEITFEFCVNAGIAETFVIDLYSTAGYTISGAILESDGSLSAVAVKIGSTSVTGLDNMTVSTVAVFTASANNVAVAGDRITINTSGTDSGTPTILRGKITL